ncbi:MAG TPA: hypothetical protein PLB81_14075 [Deltaproteobacteria bacterium]|nr:hypothetical protein [Deltaproteobacteria bacterium]
MPFIRIENIKGMVYVPEDTGGLKKHPCPDCYACQMCSDARCELCLKRKPDEKAKPKPEE